jgi:aryl-alcohol dehydrogenase-like predicted oxidoreductase
MHFRLLGRAGLKVSEIGFGAWGIGQSEWVGADDAGSLHALREARAAGVNFFDTALAYGDGHSERLIARAFGDDPNVIVATKVPPKNRVWPAKAESKLADVFPKNYVLDSLRQSVRNLGRKSVDIFQFHVWNDAWADEAEWQETVKEIRASGLARFVGISINDHQPANSLRALATGLIDTVQVIYNIFDQSPEDALFPFCLKHNIGVIARVPFDEGSLTGKIRPETTFPDDDFRHTYFKEDRKQQVWDRVEKICKDMQIPVEGLPEVALQFCLSQPAVSSVIPGMRTSRHVQANTQVSNGRRLSAEERARLNRHRWVRNFYP